MSWQELRDLMKKLKREPVLDREAIRAVGKELEMRLASMDVVRVEAVSNAEFTDVTKCSMQK